MFRQNYPRRNLPLATRRAPLTAAFLAVMAFVGPSHSLAQRGGGAHVNQSVICVYDCPSIQTLNTEDTLQNFRRAMAIQATPEQRSAFAKVSQYTEAAVDQLQAFRKSLQRDAERASGLDQAIERARAGNQNFLSSFSPAQKSALQDLVRKLAKADSDLDRQIKTLDQILPSSKADTEAIGNSCAALDKALAAFQNEQHALGREISIIFDAEGEEVTFTLPPVTNSINVDGEDISIPSSGAVLSKPSATVARTSPSTAPVAPAESESNFFGLKFVADLSDVQQNITAILRAALNRGPRCGERIEIQQASLNPLAPASSLVVADLHYERWVCPSGQTHAGLGAPSPTEVADGNATLEVKLTPSLDGAQLNLASEITRVEGNGILRNALRSGDLGVTLRDQIAASLVSTLQKSADVKSALPPVAQRSATVQKVQFQDAGADQLTLVLDGQLQFTDEQTKQFAAQLRQRLSAQGTAAP